MELLLGQHVGKDLIKSLGLPEKTLSFEIRFAYDEVIGQFLSVETKREGWKPSSSQRDTAQAAWGAGVAAVFSTYRTESRPKPKFQLSARFGGSAEVRDDFNAWLLEQFGYEEAAV